MQQKKVGRLLTVVTALLLALTAYGQQEVNPTWYDPWAPPNKVAAQPAKSRTQHGERKPSTSVVRSHQQAKTARAQPPGAKRPGVMLTRRSEGK
jgi:hypothetical protein